MDETQIDDGRIVLGSPHPNIEAQDVETISKDELYEMLRRHEPLQLINVFGRGEDVHASIKSSRRIPLEELEDHLMEFDKAKEVVTYCPHFDSERARAAAALLASHGFAARAYEGGVDEWRRAGLAIDLH